MARNAETKGMMQGPHSYAGDTWGIFWELFEFCTATQKANPPFCWQFFLKDFLKNGKKMRKKKGQCRGYGHMQETPSEYFWNCLYFAQPLKRQPPSCW